VLSSPRTPVMAEGRALASPLVAASPQPAGLSNFQPPADFDSTSSCFLLGRLTARRVTSSPPVRESTANTCLTRKSLVHLARSPALPDLLSRSSGSIWERDTAIGRLRVEVVTKPTAFAPPMVTSPTLSVSDLPPS